jgi:8-oxo-dGTP pyrophosphatase MutT (NUDIX family)
MKYRKGIFCVVYSVGKKQEVEYLILHRKLHWKGWEFPKGGLRKGENILSGVKREVREETGLKIKEIKKYNFSGKYKYNKELSDRKNFVGQTYSLYSAEVEKGKVKMDKLEHNKFKWAGYKTALKLLTWPNQKKLLRVVEKNIGKA